MSRNFKGNVLLILAALLWGVSFVMQDKAGEVLSPFAINGIRSIIGSFFLIPVILFFSKKNNKPFFEKTGMARKDLIVNYPVVLYEGETVSEENKAEYGKSFSEPLTVKLLEEQQNFFKKAKGN